MAEHGTLPKRRLGKTGVEITAFGLGGEGVLRTWDREKEAVELISRALELGITYFDCAHAYDGSEDYHGKLWGSDPSARNRIFLCSKSARRTKNEARKDLELTLRRMKTDHLDLWQVHDLRTEDEWEQLKGQGGALEAFLEAQRSGLVRFIGITGHYDPYLLARAIREFDFDTVLMPVNPAEALLNGFLDETLAAAQEKDLGVIGMKVLGGGALVTGDLPDWLIRFAISRQVSTIVVGCGSLQELEENVESALSPPLSAQQEVKLLETFKSVAKRVAYYRGVHRGAA